MKRYAMKTFPNEIEVPVLANRKLNTSDLTYAVIGSEKGCNPNDIFAVFLNPYSALDFRNTNISGGTVINIKTGEIICNPYSRSPVR